MALTQQPPYSAELVAMAAYGFLAEENTTQTSKQCTATSTNVYPNSQPLANISDVNLLASFDAETIVRHIGEVVNEGGIIVDSRDLEVNVLTGIPTFSEEYKNQVRDFLKENNVGETISDFLDYAKKKNIQIYSVPYMELLKQIGETLKIEKISTLTKMINVLTIGISFAF